MYSWKLPRYITYDLRWFRRHYKVTVRHAGKARYVGNYKTLNEAIRARDEYCHVHNIQFVEKDGWTNLSEGE